MERRHAPGHQRCPVGHADRRGDVEIFEARAGGGNAIKVGCPYNRIAVATEVVGPMLVRNDKKKVGTVRHQNYFYVEPRLIIPKF